MGGLICGRFIRDSAHANGRVRAVYSLFRRYDPRWSSIALLIQSLDPTLQIYYKCTKPSSGAAHQIPDYVVQDSAVLIVLNLD